MHEGIWVTSNIQAVCFDPRLLYLRWRKPPPPQVLRKWAWVRSRPKHSCANRIPRSKTKPPFLASKQAGLEAN